MPQTPTAILAATRPRRWDEPNAEGKTLAEEIREKLTSPVAAVQAPSNGQQVQYITPNDHGALPQPVGAPTGGQPLPQPVNAPTGGSSFVSSGDESLPPIRSLADAIAHNKEMDRRLKGPMSANGAPLSAPLEAVRAKFDKMTNVPLEANPGDPEAVDPRMRQGEAVPFPGVQSEEEMTRTRPWKAGYGVGEKDPLKREAARIRALIENPTAEVNPDGSVKPPHPMSKKKAILMGLLKGLHQASEGKRGVSLAEVLAGGATGAVIGGVKPRAIQEWMRREEVGGAQQQLADQTQLMGGQAKLDEIKADTDAKRAELIPDPNDPTKMIKRPRPGTPRAPHYEKDAEGYLIAVGEDGVAKRVPGEKGEPVRVVKQNESGEPVEVEVNGKTLKVTPGQALNYYGQVGERETKRTEAATENKGKREAKLSESDSYYNQAKEIEKNAADLDAHIKKLEEGQAKVPEFIDLGDPGHPKVVPNPARETFKTQLKDLKDAQQQQRQKANDLYKDAAKARAEGEAIPEAPPATAATAGKPQATTHGFSISGWLKAHPGKTEADAKAEHAARYKDYKLVS